MVRKMLTPTSDQATLYAFARWLVSSKRGLAQFRQAEYEDRLHGFDDVRK